MVDLSRLEAGTLALQSAPVDLYALVTCLARCVDGRVPR
jgi:hypothetical protein